MIAMFVLMKPSTVWYCSNFRQKKLSRQSKKMMMRNCVVGVVMAAFNPSNSSQTLSRRLSSSRDLKSSTSRKSNEVSCRHWLYTDTGNPLCSGSQPLVVGDPLNRIKFNFETHLEPKKYVFSTKYESRPSFREWLHKGFTTELDLN